MANVELTGAARLYRAASSDRRERGWAPGWTSAFQSINSPCIGRTVNIHVIHLSPPPGLPHVDALAVLNLVVHLVVDRLGYPNGFFGKRRKFGRIVGSLANPHKIRIASNTYACGSKLASIDTDHVIELETGVLVLRAESWPNDVVNRKVDL